MAAGGRDVHFTKVHGLGNDFILVDDLEGAFSEDEKPGLARALCRRHFGVGADGLIFATPPTSGEFDVRFQIFNADGSQAEMCGNGIRAFAKFVHERGVVAGSEVRVETLAGLVVPKLNFDGGGRVRSVTVDMGEFSTDPARIPVVPPADGSSDESNGFIDGFVDRPVIVLDREFRVTAVSMGNPHAVTFLGRDDPLDGDEGLEFVRKYGAALESNVDLFPKKVNVEFARVLSGGGVRMRVFERGVGVTLACGTGACATVVAGVLLGKLPRDAPVTVRLDGGELEVEVRGRRVFMTGPAEEVFEGVARNVRPI